MNEPYCKEYVKALSDQWRFRSGPEVIKLFSYSTQLSMQFFLLINIKMPTIVGILIFISRKNFMLSSALQEKSLNWWYLIFYKRKNFILSWVEHEKSFITLGPDQLTVLSGKPRIYRSLMHSKGSDWSSWMHSLTGAFTGCFCNITAFAGCMNIVLL